MKINFKNKKLKICASVIAGLLVGGYLVFSHGGYKKYDSNESFKALMSVVLNTAKSKGEIELTEKEINALGSSYFKDGLKKGNLTLKGFNVHLEEEKVSILIPVKYNGLPLLLSTSGEFNIENEEITYTPKAFKVGKILVPKSLVMNFISNNFKNKLYVDKNTIVINKGLLPNDIESIKFANEKIFLVAKDEAKKLLKETSETIKKIEEQAKVGSASNPNAVSSKSGTSNSSTGVAGGNANNSTSYQNDSSKKDTEQSLAQIAGELGALQGSASTSKEKQMLSIMSSTASTLQNDPSYNFWGDVKEVMTIYKTLTPEEKKVFKAKVFSGVDMDNAMVLKGDYGM